MADHDEISLPTMTPEDCSRAVQNGAVTAFFQPIEALQTGKCCGFEALARLPFADKLLTPDAFLSDLSADDRLSLFATMLNQSIAFLKHHESIQPDLYVSINVEISLIVCDDFVDVLRYLLERYDFRGERLVLEILESEDVCDVANLKKAIEAIKAMGLSVALDDIGSAYASLYKIKHLPIDIIKLDRSFSRDLERQPEDLMFVLSMYSLAVGLGKRMIVEGIESDEVYDALRIMGVELGQGYGIARPMPAVAVAGWLAKRTIRENNKIPRCLLGAYASHFTIVTGCRVLHRQPLPITWGTAAADHRLCVIGQLFAERGWHDTPFGDAHRLFHEVLPLYDKDPERWNMIAALFQSTMAAAIATDPREMGCNAKGAGEELCACTDTRRLSLAPAPPVKRRRFVASR